MKLTHGILSITIAIGTLSVLAVHAGSTTVLEGFENGFTVNSQGQTNIVVGTGFGVNPRGAPVSISIYTATGPGDPRVTQGTHSAKIVFPTDGFGNDFSISLSDLACSMIESAAISNQPARYILRYDVIFEQINLVTYFNQHFFIANNWDYVRSGGGYRTNYNGELFEVDSYSVAVELPGVAMPTNSFSGTNSGDFNSSGVTGVTAACSDQFAAVTEPLNNFTIYIDNIRLIDTYETPAATPLVFTVQSFETSSPPLGGATDLAPTTTGLSLYTTNHQFSQLSADAERPGATNVCSLGNSYFIYDSAQATAEQDFAVTDGTNCLAVSNNFVGYSPDVFSLPLGTTRLQQILNLNLTPAQLAHYTVRWDVTTPYVPVLSGAGDGDYFQLDYNATTGSILPMSTGRRQTDLQYGLQRQTYSATLDQIAYWGASAALSVSTSLDTNWINAPFYFDNFRLIDTAPHYTAITAASFNPGTSQFTLTWLSAPSETYSVHYSTTPAAGYTTLATGIPSGGDYTTNTVTIPPGSAAYLLISSP